MTGQRVRKLHSSAGVAMKPNTWIPGTGSGMTIKSAYTVCRILSLVMSGANASCQSASRAKTSSPALIV